MKNIFTALAIGFAFTSCITAKHEVFGTWKLTAEIDSEDMYAKRSSLKEKKIVSDKIFILKNDSTFVSNLSLCNQYNKKGIYQSQGRITFKKNANPDRIFKIECPGIYPVHYFIIREKKLELYYPSFGTGYQIKIFEK